MLTAGTVIVLVVAAQAGVPQAGNGSGCAVVDSIGQCLVAAVDPGRPGGPGDPARKPARKAATAARAPRTVAAAPVNRAAPAPEPVPEADLRNVYPPELLAAELLSLPNSAPGTAPAARAPTRATTVATLTRRTTERLTLRPPALHTSAGEDGLVGMPVWLWIDPATATPLTTTATAGAAAVTATARLTAVTWAMGPPGALVRCTGPGTPWTGQAGASPDCGYVYALRSLPERTGGQAAWTITATCTWTVTFSGTSAGAPVAAEQTIDVSTSIELPVGEVQVLVGGDGS
ncbi:MAG: hypothetical protein L0H84_04265 [Pseudonocardia sp.]|nr:hypothetical protein [Pseudonocardia sp.]